MHGLINRALQSFLRDTYGTDLWREVATGCGLGAEGFEAMLIYDDALTHALLDGAARRLDRPVAALLEDAGTYLVSNPNMDALRRLLRFGGVGFVDFLYSLDDLQGRSRLAVPDLDLPALEVSEATPGRFTLICRAADPGFAHVLVGVLRAMADDYGALVLIDLAGQEDDRALITIDLLDAGFATGRQFELLAQRE